MGLFKFKDGTPFNPTDGQCEIFASIIDPEEKWIWTSAPTRYGKSEIISLAVLYLAAFHHLKIPIVGGSYDKAQKIMDYIVQHVADDSRIYEKLINIQGVDAVEKLKVSVAKTRLRWSDGGWIFVTSIDSRSYSKEGEGVVGEGGDVVILEESGLIKNNDLVSKVIRMPERDRGWGKLVQSGNCIENSIFQKAYESDLYIKIKISLDQAKIERNWKDEELNEKKSQMTVRDWKRYFLVEFPSVNEFTYFKPQKYDLLPYGEIRYYGAVDFAMGETDKGCYTAIEILGKESSGQVYEIESIIDKVGPDEAMNRILNLPYKFVRFGVEGTLFQEYLYKVLSQKSRELGSYIPFTAIDQKKNKKERIESMEPYINTGQILFKGSGELWNEMQTYPDAEYVDGLDALEMCWRMISQASSGIMQSAKTNLYSTGNANL